MTTKNKKYMDDKKFQNKYRIPSARAVWHDYNGGAYFITVCAKNREHLFGEIAHCRDGACTVSTNEPRMQLSEIGQYLTEIIQNTPEHCPYCDIPLFVVMPNHWHAIVMIDTTRRDGACTVSTNNERWRNTIVDEKMQQISIHKKSLAVAIGCIKSAVTKFANENGLEFGWQTRFHDRIIRDQKMMNAIADYVENNVARWDTDCFNKK
jgi:REP element-mobilizing transposase RayT